MLTFVPTIAALAGITNSEGVATELPSGVSMVTPTVLFRLGELDRGQCNGGYIIGEDCVIGVEAPTPEGSEEMIREAEAICGKPIRYVVITHGHGDHDGGVDVFAQSGVTIICSETLRRRYLEQGKQGSFIGVDGKLSATLGGQVFEFHTFGAAHCNTDLFTVLPEHRVLFTGDALVNSATLYMGDCDLRNWLVTLATLDTLGVKSICPGHGPVGESGLPARLASYLITLRRAVGDQLSRGASLEEALASVDIPNHTDWTMFESWWDDHIKAAYSQLSL